MRRDIKSRYAVEAISLSGKQPVHSVRSVGPSERRTKVSMSYNKTISSRDPYNVNFTFICVIKRARTSGCRVVIAWRP